MSVTLYLKSVVHERKKRYSVNLQRKHMSVPYPNFPKNQGFTVGQGFAMDRSVLVWFSRKNCTKLVDLKSFVSMGYCQSNDRCFI